MKRSIELRRILLAGAAVSAVLLAAGCGADSMSGMKHSATAPGASATPFAGASFNEADIMFAQMMIPHHRQAVEMADLAPTRADDSELKELATRIKAAQDPEIVTMTGWLTAWGKPTAAPGGYDMHGMTPMPSMSGMSGMGMAGMATQRQMDELRAASGTAFDRMFAQLMIAHHNGAIEMARIEQANGENGDAKALAAKIAADQAAEVQTLQKILDRL